MSTKRLHSVSPQETSGEHKPYRLRKRANLGVIPKVSKKATTSASPAVDQVELGQAPSDNIVSMTSLIGQMNCGLCNSPTEDISLKCTYCERHYHPTTLCTGLKPLSIQCLLEEDSTALQYRCTSCRCSVNQSPGASANQGGSDGQEWKVAVGQVLEIVKALATNMTQMSVTLNNQMQSIAIMPPQAGASSQPTPRDSAEEPVSKKELYTELWEFEERKKRASSVIVKGVEATNNHEFNDKFRVVYQFLLHSSPQITNTHCIDGAKKIYRVTFQNKTTRVDILREAKKLAESSHKDIYISRDLTYTQRQELKARRAARTSSQQGNQPTNSANTSGSRNSNRRPLSGSNLEPLSPSAVTAPQQPPPLNADGRGSQSFQ